MDVGAWLRALGLERYVEAFAADDIDAEVLPALSETDLEKLGVTLGHRKRLLKAIQALACSPDPPRAQAASAAERRQLTVLFGDLVGSTALSGALDPEDMGRILEAYQGACQAVIARWGGRVAKYMGDGVLAYFGWPEAHEDDAERAVRAGLDLARAVAGLSAPDGHALAVRVGIATGLVMVGELVGEGSAREEAVVGETPNLAARLQALAAPGAVVIAPATRRLVGGLFELEDLGSHALKGFAQPVAVTRALAEGRAQNRFEAVRGTQLGPLVGREHELGLLLDRWRRASEGEGQVVLLAGEAGIGKSRLVRAFREQVAGHPHTALSHYASPFHTNSPLHPVIGLLERAAGLAPDDSPATKITKLEGLLGQATENLAEVVPLVAALLGLDGGAAYPAPALTPERQKQQTLEVLLGQVVGLVARQPVLVVYEDAHWLDPTTLEAVAMLIGRVARLPVLVLITHRPEFDPPWRGHAHVTQLSLTRLARREGAAVVARVTGGRPLPAEVLEQVLEKTDGVPLFVEELTKTVLESGLLRDAGDHFELSGPLPPLAIPATLHDSLMARLDRVAPVREIAQIGAVIGRDFSHALLAAVAGRPEPDLAAALDQLVAAELIFRRGTLSGVTYSFKHALIRDAAYESLLRHRRRAFHGAIYQALSSPAHPAPPDTRAVHAAGAGLFLEAARHGLDAGRRALERWAPREAARLLKRSLAHLAEIPDAGDRDLLELELQASLAPALLATSGYSADATGDAYGRTGELARLLGQPARLAQAQFGEFLFRLVRGELRTAASVAEQMLEGAADGSDGADLAMAHRAAGTSAFFMGKFAHAARHLDEAHAQLEAASREPTATEYVFDPATGIAAFSSLVWLAIGRLDRADEFHTRSRALAEATDHVATVAFDHHHACFFAMASGRPNEVRCRAEAMVQLAEEERLPIWLATGRLYLGWAMAVSDPGERAVEFLDDGLSRWRATGARLWLPVYLGLRADALGAAGCGKEARALLRKTLNLAATTADAHFVTELHRRLGVLHKEAGELQEAEASLLAACRLAREQGARLYQLRAARDLARLWAGQGERQKAVDLLAPIHGWFTEGFDTPDLIEAKVLLEELR